MLVWQEDFRRTRLAEATRADPDDGGRCRLALIPLALGGSAGSEIQTPDCDRHLVPVWSSRRS